MATFFSIYSCNFLRSVGQMRFMHFRGKALLLSDLPKSPLYREN